MYLVERIQSDVIIDDELHVNMFLASLSWLQYIIEYSTRYLFLPI
jgi:hypothetical protein